VVECLIYCRVSTGKQAEDGVSLDLQLRDNRAYASRQEGWVLGQEYVDVLSGKRDDRPDYQRLLSDIRTLTSMGRRVAVVVWRLDRLGRKMLERVRSREELVALGCETHSAMEGGLVSDLVANILASVAAEEVRTLSERTTKAMNHIKDSGWYKVKGLPFGYTSRDATPDERKAGAPRRTLEVDLQQATVAREAYRRLAAGEPLRGVTRWMRALPAEDRGHRTWAMSTVRRMLTAPVYVARQESQDTDVLHQSRGHWPALVSDDLYRRVQEELALNTRLPRRTMTKHLLTGFLRCPRPACGHPTTGEPALPATPRSKARGPRYRCAANAEDFRCTAAVPAPAIEEEVMRQVDQLMNALRLDADLMRELRSEWNRLRGADRDTTADEARRLRALSYRGSIEQGRQLLAKATRMLVAEEIDRTAYNLMRQDIEREMDESARRLSMLEEQASIRPSIPPLDVVLERLGRWRTALASVDVDASRRVLAELVERIDPVKVGHGHYEVRITWTPVGEALGRIAQSTGAAA